MTKSRGTGKVMTTFNRWQNVVAVLLCVTIADGADLRSAVQNPISSLVSLPFQFNFDNGAENGDANILNIQPVYPITHGNWNYVSRLIVPIVDAPGGTPGLPSIPNSQLGERTQGLGDINYSLFLSPAKVGTFTWGVGPSVSLPTASDKALGSGKWSVGPTFVILGQPSWGTAGALFRQIWSFAGDTDRPDLSQFLFEPFLNYNLRDGWFLISDMVWTSNWHADSGNQWTIPIGGGIGRVFKIADQPINSRLEGYKNAFKPDGASDWTVRFTFQFLFPK